MKYFIRPFGTSGKDSKKDSLQTKLYVAYINHDAVNDPDDLYMEETADDFGSYKATAFVSSGKKKSLKPMPVILSYDEEMMLFDQE